MNTLMTYPACINIIWQYGMTPHSSRYTTAYYKAVLLKGGFEVDFRQTIKEGYIIKVWDNALCVWFTFTFVRELSTLRKTAYVPDLHELGEPIIPTPRKEF